MLRLDLFGSPTHWADYDEGVKSERSWQTIRHERLQAQRLLHAQTRYTPLI